MTIDVLDLLALLEEAKARPFAGEAFVAGGEVAFGSGTLQAAAAHFDMALPLPSEAGLSTDGLFRALGFSAVQVCSEDGALGQPHPPEHLAGRFSAVFDFGESQRTFRLPDAFAHLGRLVAPNGRLLHVAPSANNMDAVWYMLSPTLLYDHYRANEWVLERLDLLRQDRDKRAVERLAYEPGLLYPVSHGGLDDAAYRVVCVARRAMSATVGRIPQQSFYEKAWDAGTAGNAGPGRGGALKRLIRGNRLIYRALYSLAMSRTKRRFRAASLKPLARYPVASWTGGR